MSVKRALVCAPAMPEFDRESGSRRVFDHIEFLLDAGWSVSFATQTPPSEPRYVRMLAQRRVATYVGFDSRLEQLVTAGRFDLALLAFWHAAEPVLPILRRFSPATRVLVDSIDLHCLRNARGIRQTCANSGTPTVLTGRLGSEMVRELNAYAAADGVLTVSQKEADWISDFLGEPKLALVSPDAEDVPASAHSFAERKGILFIGNFRHAPNVDAVEYLCREVVPFIDPALLAEHPLYVVGNHLNDKIAALADDLQDVHMVGWVPSVEPYLHRARVSVVPLRYGAGTKRKLLQALMAGTPTISTSIGVEGLSLEHGRHVLIADDAQDIGQAACRLLREAEPWESLAREGRAHAVALHGRDVVSARFNAVIAEALDRPVKRGVPTRPGTEAIGPDAYACLIDQICSRVQSIVPAGAKVLVASRGDDRLLAIAEREAGHFPQTDSGVYAGHHPANSREAIDHLEALRGRGHRFLLFPRTAFWWLDHYGEFAKHLTDHYDRVASDQDCILFRLESRERQNGSVASAPGLSAAELDKRRPSPAIEPARLRLNGTANRSRVLVLGIYLADQLNTAEDIVANLGSSTRTEVTQRWVALGGEPKSGRLAHATARSILKRTPKFTILNDLLADERLDGYDYVVVFDDDIVLPEGFLDSFIALQGELGFALAQPARTSNSYIDHPIVEQQRGVLARQTLFVEIGPAFSVHRSCFGLVFPFDLSSPMGWGYEHVWAYRLNQRGLKMGIIDAFPVDHSLRKPVANYGWADADRQRKAYLRRNAHYPLDHCYRVLEVTNFPAAGAESSREPAAT